jgi:hypothetical protein
VVEGNSSKSCAREFADEGNVDVVGAQAPVLYAVLDRRIWYRCSIVVFFYRGCVYHHLQVTGSRGVRDNSGSTTASPNKSEALRVLSHSGFLRKA